MYGEKDIHHAYSTGRGGIVVRGEAEIVEDKKGQYQIIISSIPGVAITSLSIEGVKHEFSTIEGIKEDVISIILNLKAVNFVVHGDELQKITLKVKGPKVITANDIEHSSAVEIINKDAYICEITDKVSLDIEMNLEKGKALFED